MKAKVKQTKTPRRLNAGLLATSKYNRFIPGKPWLRRLASQWKETQEQDVTGGAMAFAEEFNMNRNGRASRKQVLSLLK